LLRPADVTPNLEVHFVITPPDIIIARRLRCDLLRHGGLGLVDSDRLGFAAGDKKCSKQNLKRQKKNSDAFHPVRSTIINTDIYSSLRPAQMMNQLKRCANPSDP